MVKRGMNLLAILAGSVAASMPAAQDDANVGVNWEIRYSGGQIVSEQQVDLTYDKSKVSGSLVLDDFQLSKWGMSAAAANSTSNVGNFSARRPTSYFNSTKQARMSDTFVGMRTEYLGSNPQRRDIQWFGGTTLADERIFIDANRFSPDRDESKIYFRSPEGSLIGISNQKVYGQNSSGMYYAKKDLDTYTEVSNKGIGARVALRNILGKMKGIIVDQDERLDAEVEHVSGKRSSAMLKYLLPTKWGMLSNLNIAIGATRMYEEGAQAYQDCTRALFQNSIALGAAKINMRYEPSGKRFRLDVNAQY